MKCRWSPFSLKQNIFGTDNKALVHKVYTRAIFSSFIKSRGLLYMCREKTYRSRQYSFWGKANPFCEKIYPSLGLPCQ